MWPVSSLLSPLGSAPESLCSNPDEKLSPFLESTLKLMCPECWSAKWTSQRVWKFLEGFTWYPMQQIILSSISLTGSKSFHPPLPIRSALWFFAPYIPPFCPVPILPRLGKLKFSSLLSPGSSAPLLLVEPTQRPSVVLGPPSTAGMCGCTFHFSLLLSWIGVGDLIRRLLLTSGLHT